MDDPCESNGDRGNHHPSLGSGERNPSDFFLCSSRWGSYLYNSASSIGWDIAVRASNPRKQPYPDVPLYTDHACVQLVRHGNGETYARLCNCAEDSCSGSTSGRVSVSGVSKPLYRNRRTLCGCVPLPKESKSGGLKGARKQRISGPVCRGKYMGRDRRSARHSREIPALNPPDGLQPRNPGGVE